MHGLRDPFLHTTEIVAAHEKLVASPSDLRYVLYSIEGNRVPKVRDPPQNQDETL